MATDNGQTLDTEIQKSFIHSANAAFMQLKRNIASALMTFYSCYSCFYVQYSFLKNALYDLAWKKEMAWGLTRTKLLARCWSSALIKIKNGLIFSSSELDPKISPEL